MKLLRLAITKITTLIGRLVVRLVLVVEASLDCLQGIDNLEDREFKTLLGLKQEHCI